MNGKDALFADKSAWFALAGRSDSYHKKAINIYPGLIKSLHHLTTTNLIIAETYILISRSIGHQVRRSIGYQAAIIFLESINSSSQIRKFILTGYWKKKRKRFSGNIKIRISAIPMQ